MTSATILIVDDEEPIRVLIRGYLEREGFTVHEAMDGPAAAYRRSGLSPRTSWCST